MGLELKFKIEESATSDYITIYDKTGIYHSVNNPTGWGGANPSIATVETVLVEVVRPDPTTLQLSTDDTFRTVLDLFGLPNLIGNPTIISLLDLSADELIDGRYRFKVTIFGTVVSTPYEFVYQVEKVFYNKTFCAALKAQSEADLKGCGCSECRDKLFKMNILLCAVDEVIANNKCGKPNKALEALKTAQGIDSDCVKCT